MNLVNSPLESITGQPGQQKTGVGRWRIVSVAVTVISVKKVGLSFLLQK